MAKRAKASEAPMEATHTEDVSPKELGRRATATMAQMPGKSS